MDIPKKIWFLWLQGFDEMPEITKVCYESWVQLNPGYEVVFLDEHNLSNYIDVQYVFEAHGNLYPVSKSEVIRINLLKKYGGIWADATCICMKPLDSWLHPYMSSGFFAFSRPGRDRMLSSWFLAAESKNPLVEKYCEAANNFWLENTRIRGWSDVRFIHWFFLRFKIHGYLKNRPTLWMKPFIVKFLKVYPYFWFFYLFEKLYQEHGVMKKCWDATPKFSADIPHRFQNLGYYEEMSDALKEEIKEGKSPVYKLTFKFEKERLYDGCVMDFFLKGFDHIKKMLPVNRN